MRGALGRDGVLPALALGVASTLLIGAAVLHVPRLRDAVDETPPGAPASARPGVSRTAADYAALPGWHLLGATVPAAGHAAVHPAPQAGPGQQDAGIDPAQLPRAAVNFTLRGVAYSEDSHRAYAIVAGPDGAQKRYAVGESPHSGVVIERITPREIVVRQAGRLERVALPKPEEMKGDGVPALPAVLPMEQLLPESPPPSPDAVPPPPEP